MKIVNIHRQKANNYQLKITLEVHIKAKKDTINKIRFPEVSIKFMCTLQMTDFISFQ